MNQHLKSKYKNVAADPWKPLPHPIKKVRPFEILKTPEKMVMEKAPPVEEKIEPKVLIEGLLGP